MEAEKEAKKELRAAKKKLTGDTVEHEEAKSGHSEFVKNVLETFQELQNRENVEYLENVEELEAIVVSPASQTDCWDKCQKTLKTEMPHA